MRKLAKLETLSRTVTLTTAFALSAVYVPASADDLIVYDVDPGTGPGAIASGSFTFDQTADTITSWDISVVDGGLTTVFESGGRQSSTYGFRATAWDAHFSTGSSTYLDFYFASPGLGAITSAPATVDLLEKSVEIVAGVGAQIDNPSVSSVVEPATLVSLLIGLGLAGLLIRGRCESAGKSSARELHLT